MEDVRDQLLNINMSRQQQSEIKIQLLKKLYKLESTQTAQDETFANFRKEVAELTNKSKSPNRTRPHSKKRNKSTKINIESISQQSQKLDEKFLALDADTSTEADDSDFSLSSRTVSVQLSRDSKTQKRVLYHIRDNIEYPDQERRDIGKHPDTDLH